ncbi:hypothetical protein M404DRAFT_995864 [Pisolithus tinctorius Marx 270]|uniref:Uncharacterized protein n=1 Tax=Pisolithus tinctorius Marx 270 TaxID=870435 RepID=A0A0C3PM73_PISTI|nr:hypothetical protein M404DRAFT_995864 [Pisolithus tinctorius Marx 270]
MVSKIPQADQMGRPLCVLEKHSPPQYFVLSKSLDFCASSHLYSRLRFATVITKALRALPAAVGKSTQQNFIYVGWFGQLWYVWSQQDVRAKILQ